MKDEGYISLKKEENVDQRWLATTNLVENIASIFSTIPKAFQVVSRRPGQISCGEYSQYVSSESNRQQSCSLKGEGYMPLSMPMAKLTALIAIGVAFVNYSQQKCAGKNAVNAKRELNQRIGQQLSANSDVDSAPSLSESIPETSKASTEQRFGSIAFAVNDNNSTLFDWQ